MTGMVRGLFGLAVAAAAILAMVAPSAAQEAPSGTVETTTWTAGAGFGAGKGDGVLSLADGRKYGILVENLKVGTVGVSYVQATGTIYNLKRVQDNVFTD